jgi:rhodanese-related sulfurtransferase
MALIFASIATLLLIGIWIKKRRDRNVLEQHSITPDALHSLLASNQDVLIFDVRQPLDLLTDSEIIPGAKRLAPKEVIGNPSLIPKERHTVVYCTCSSDKTSRHILKRALDLDFFQVKFLKGGLGAWKAKGYPVEPYDETFRLDSGG